MSVSLQARLHDCCCCGQNGQMHRQLQSNPEKKACLDTTQTPVHLRALPIYKKPGSADFLPAPMQWRMRNMKWQICNVIQWEWELKSLIKTFGVVSMQKLPYCEYRKEPWEEERRRQSWQSYQDVQLPVLKTLPRPLTALQWISVLEVHALPSIVPLPPVSSPSPVIQTICKRARTPFKTHLTMCSCPSHRMRINYEFHSSRWTNTL